MCIESKDISWAWVTADRALSKQKCELIYAHVANTGATTDSVIYDGVDANGKKIVQLYNAAATGLNFNPPLPVFCENGLFVDVGSNITGILVQWRNL